MGHSMVLNIFLRTKSPLLAPSYDKKLPEIADILVGELIALLRLFLAPAVAQRLLTLLAKESTRTIIPN